MYIIQNDKMNYKLENKEVLREIEGFSFGGRRAHKIAGEEIVGLKIYNQKLAYPIVKKQVEKKYQKLMLILPDLLVSDDEEGEGLIEALTQIEKFRQMIKNKYREYLKRKDLEEMSKQLSILQKQAKIKLLELQNALANNKISKGKGSAK